MKLNFKGLVALTAITAMVPASATIARLKALGMDETDNEGSYYIDDDRNIFLNAANVNSYSDTVILEWGSEGQNFGSASLKTDEDYNPKAKGGFLKTHGNYVYGIYVGNESNTSALLRGVATGAYAAHRAASTGGAVDTMLDGADNQVDFFFGGKASSMDWGVNVVYTSDKKSANRAHDRGSAVRFGAKADKWQGFLNLSTSSYAEQVDTLPALGSFAGGDVFHEFQGKLGFHLGGSYKVNPMGSVYGFYKQFDWEQTDSSGTTAGLGTLAGVNADGRGQAGTTKAGFKTYALGYGHVMKTGNGTAYANIEYRHKDIHVDFTSKSEAKNVFIPLTFGYEYDATSWLTLRGSVSQKIWGYRENKNYSSLSYIGNSAAISQFGTDTGGKKATFTNSTNVNAGASLKFKRLKIDGLIGIGQSNGTLDNASPIDGDHGVLDLDRLLARVGVTYNF